MSSNWLILLGPCTRVVTYIKVYTVVNHLRLKLKLSLLQFSLPGLYFKRVKKRFIINAYVFLEDILKISKRDTILQ